LNGLLLPSYWCIKSSLLCSKIDAKISENEDYAEFTNRAKVNPVAVKVKLNDLTDNLDIKRMPVVLESDLKRLNKYLKAYNELLNIGQ
jgi:hypothetical protein